MRLVGIRGFTWEHGVYVLEFPTEKRVRWPDEPFPVQER